MFTSFLEKSTIYIRPLRPKKKKVSHHRSPQNVPPRQTFCCCFLTLNIQKPMVAALRMV